MNDHLNLLNSEVRARELRREAELWRLGHRNGDDHLSVSPRLPSTLVIRMAWPTDDEALTRLAQVDGHHVHDGAQLLVAEVEGEVLAALPLDGGDAIANPFRSTAALVEMLELRAGQQLRNGAPPRRGLRARLSRMLRGGAHRPAVAPATPGNARMLIPRD